MLEYHKGTNQSFLDRFEELWPPLWETVIPTNRICLLTTCSHAKPYSKSWIHMEIRRALHRMDMLDRVAIVHVSSAGLIPTECALDYPFCAYDWNDAEATHEERQAYIERAKLRLFWLLHKRLFSAHIAYFIESDDNWQAVNIFPQIIKVSVPVQSAKVWELHPDVDTPLGLEWGLYDLYSALCRLNNKQD